MRFRNCLFLFLIFTIMFLPSCAKKGVDGPKPAIPGKVMVNPEVTLQVGVSPEGVVLPTVSEIRWDFFQEEGRKDYVCKMKMKTVYNDEKKFMAQIQLIDLNNFPVTTQQLKMDGVKGEEVTYDLVIYIEPQLSKKITKAKVVLEII